MKNITEEFWCIVCKKFYPLMVQGANADMEVGGWCCVWHTEQELDEFRFAPKTFILDLSGVEHANNSLTNICILIHNRFRDGQVSPER